MLDSFLVSTGVVALAEIGDKTQLLSMALAAKYRRPWPIIAGILAATLVSHGAAGGIGTLLSGVLDPLYLDWAVVASFLLMAGWILFPDRAGDGGETAGKGRYGVFAATALAFFLAEFGDKTQIATIALAARYHVFLPVVAGTTLGMMLANVPVVLLGHRFADRLPASTVRILTALCFLLLGGLALRKALSG